MPLMDHNPLGGLSSNSSSFRTLSDTGPLSTSSHSSNSSGRDMDSKYELEDYIYEMECRNPEEPRGDPPDDEDIYSRLEQKERDLILAAELGKALLERNEILVQQNERQAEDYSQKLEILEQEKHTLRRKLHATEGEYEVKIQELSTDLLRIRGEVEDEREVLRQNDKEKSVIIEELTEQNSRLTAQLKESSKHEEQLNKQVQLLRDQMNLRKSNMSEQCSTLDVLREEINLLNDKKLELERRIDSLVMEREGLSVTLDESTDRILMLEKQSREQEQLIRTSERDMNDLRHTNLSLTDRLEMVSRNSSSPSMGQTSLMNEIDMSDHEASRPHSHPSLQEDLLELDEDIECDDPILMPMSDGESLKVLRQEVVDVVGQLRVMIDQIRHKRRNSLTSLSTNSSDELTSANLKTGLLSIVVKELQGLIRDQLRREAQGQCNACGRSSTDDRVQLEQEVHRALESVDKMNIELSDTKDKLKAKTDEAADLGGQVSLKEAQLKAVQEERDNYKNDIKNTHLAKDELIKKAWDMRDNAVARKNACEIELARTRIDVMQVNSQLMEAIQQKIELSQQLEQWQVDMQQLLDDQMRKKLGKLEMSMAGNKSRAYNQGSDSDSSGSGKISPRKNSRFLSLLTTLKR